MNSKLSDKFVLDFSIRIMKAALQAAEDYQLLPDNQTIYELGMEIAMQGISLMNTSNFKSNQQICNDLSFLAEELDKKLSELKLKGLPFDVEVFKQKLVEDKPKTENLEEDIWSKFKYQNSTDKKNLN